MNLFVELFQFIPIYLFQKDPSEVILLYKIALGELECSMASQILTQKCIFLVALQRPISIRNYMSSDNTL